jgi:hypothetical protein
MVGSVGVWSVEPVVNPGGGHREEGRVALGQLSSGG